MKARGKLDNVTVVAIARELTCSLRTTSTAASLHPQPLGAVGQGAGPQAAGTRQSPISTNHQWHARS